MQLTLDQIKNLDKVYRLNLINSITGIKPANLIGSKNKDGDTNLAIFSSIVHLGSDPALIGFILRPYGEVPRHTYENLKEIGFYTINHVLNTKTEEAHYTSAKFEKEESEFDFCGFGEQYVDGFEAPFVAESKVKFGLRFVEEIPIPINGTTLIIGQIELIILEDALVSDKGYIDLELAQTAGISGLNSYYELTKIDSYPYARRKEVPDFTNEEK